MTTTPTPMPTTPTTTSGLPPLGAFVEVLFPVGTFEEGDPRKAFEGQKLEALLQGYRAEDHVRCSIAVDYGGQPEVAIISFPSKYLVTK